MEALAPVFSMVVGSRYILSMQNVVCRYARSLGAGKSVDSRECMCSGSCSFRQTASKGMRAVENEGNQVGGVAELRWSKTGMRLVKVDPVK